MPETAAPTRRKAKRISPAEFVLQVLLARVGREGASALADSSLRSLKANAAKAYDWYLMVADELEDEFDA